MDRDRAGFRIDNPDDSNACRQIERYLRSISGSESFLSAHLDHQIRDAFEVAFWRLTKRKFRPMDKPGIRSNDAVRVAR